MPFSTLLPNTHTESYARTVVQAKAHGLFLGLNEYGWMDTLS